MWDKEKVDRYGSDLRIWLHSKLKFLERYDHTEISTVEVVLNKTPKLSYEVSKDMGKIIYDTVSKEVEEILIKLAILQAGEGASIKDIFNWYAANYCNLHLSAPSSEAFEKHHCKYCAHSENCPYYLDANDNYRLKATQEEAQEYCNRQDHCEKCMNNTVCSYECLTVNNQFAILGKPLADSLFVRKEGFVEYKFKTEWRKYIDEVNAFCTDYNVGKMNTFQEANMTFAILKEIFEEHNIPSDAVLMSDSNWELDATHMDGVFYNEETNQVVFTQESEYEDKYNEAPWKSLYNKNALKSQEDNNDIQRIFAREH